MIAGAESQPQPARSRRVTIRKPGDFDELTLEAFQPRAPDAHEIAIDVHAAGVNFADTAIRMGVYRSAKEFVGWPITPGFEVSGIVREVGQDVTRAKPGDKVVAVTLFGGNASDVVVHEDFVFALPDKLSFEQAAGLPAVALTAYYALHELAHPRQGANVLVHSAAGGVGSYLVQLAKAAGCQVVGVVGRTEKVAIAKGHGCDLVIDKSRSDLWQAAEAFAPNGYDVVLDANGVATLKASYDHLASAGKLVVYGFATMLKKGRGRVGWPKLIKDYLLTPRFNPLKLTNENKSVLAFNLSYLFERKDILADGMKRIFTLLEQGKISAPQVTTYALDNVADAHRDIQSGTTTGKLILLP